MKKKRLRLVTTIAILAALFGSGGGVAWGQAYKKREFDLSNSKERGMYKLLGSVDGRFFVEERESNQSR